MLNQGGKFPTTSGTEVSQVESTSTKQIEKVMLLEGFNTSEFCFGDEGCLPPFFLGGGRVFSNITPQEGYTYTHTVYIYIYIYICTYLMGVLKLFW